jgi:hypothetical protein
MNPKSSVIVTFLALVLISAGVSTAPNLAQSAKKVEFFCGRTNDIYPATMLAIRGNDPRTIVVWKNTFGQMSPQQRCDTISPRFQKALERHGLDLLIAGLDRKTGQGLICAIKYGEKKCDLQHMLFAVNNQQNAQEIIHGLYDSIRRTGNPIVQSSSGESIDVQELINSMDK